MPGEKNFNEVCVFGVIQYKMNSSIQIKSASTILTVILSLTFFDISKAQVGAPAPDFTVTDTHGETHHLYDYLSAGKVVVLDFFYTDCRACQFYSPEVDSVFAKYGCNSANVIFMGIDHDDNNLEVLDYDQQYQIPYPSMSGLEGGGNEVAALYNIQSYPTFYVIDSTKTIVRDIYPPTLENFDVNFQQLGILPSSCDASSVKPIGEPKCDIALFPNPVSSHEYLSIQMPVGNLDYTHFEIINYTGQRVASGQLGMNNSTIVEMNVSNLIPGLYLLTINPENGSVFYSGCFVRK